MNWNFDSTLWGLVLFAGFIMVTALIKGIMTTTNVAAMEMISTRRTAEAIRARMNAEAAALGKAAALEPLNINPDGSVEEPIMSVVEKTEG